ncbi:hypothetical protein [Paraburkholderia sp. J8-2]|uniref:hypothetical protein n=1 Tax=Paraburkholderia sp. J8-2 TaxID=2805440 RepID=UPI002AB5E5DD|nr:hypothetical protein [Paraburkholderia sp. J8-2]
MNKFRQMTSEIDRKALVEAIARALGLRCEPLPPLLTDAIALNSTLARVARRISFETHMYEWATKAKSLRMSSVYMRQHAKLKSAVVWHRSASWGSLALKLLRPLAPDEIDDGNCDALQLEFLLNALAEDPLMLSSRRDGTFQHLPVDILLTQRINEYFHEYFGPGMVHPFEGHHFVQGCVLYIFCDAGNAAVRAGVATALSRVMSAELDAEIVSLVQEARRTHEITRPH